MVWAVWPGALLLPVLLIAVRFALQISGWGTFTMMLFVLPVLEFYGAVVAVLVTVRAARVTPHAAGLWTSVLLTAHWVLLTVCALSIGDAGDTSESVVAAPLEQWGLPGPLVNGLAVVCFVTTVVCAPQVPCGAATRELLATAGLTVRPVSEESSVTDVLGKVTSGQADAGLVYVTDATGAGDAVRIVSTPEARTIVNVYPIALARHAVEDPARKATAEAFVNAVTSAKGRQVLTRAGFGVPGT